MAILCCTLTLFCDLVGSNLFAIAYFGVPCSSGFKTLLRTLIRSVELPPLPPINNNVGVANGIGEEYGEGSDHEEDGVRQN